MQTTSHQLPSAVPVAAEDSPEQGQKQGATRFVLAASATALALAGQALVATDNLRWAMAPYVVAVAAMALAAASNHMAARPSQVEGIEEGLSPDDGDFSEALRRREGRFAMAGLVLSALMLALGLRLFPSGPPNTLSWWLYGFSVALLLLALPALDGRWSRAVALSRTRPVVSLKLEAMAPWLALGVVLMLAAIIRLYNLQELPAGLWFDEADNLSHAREIARDPGRAPVFVRSTNLPSMFLLPMAAVVELTGVSIGAARVVSVAFGLAGIAAVFLLVRLMGGPMLGLAAAVLAATMRWDINWSRLGMHGITTPLFAALSAFLTLRAMRTGRLSDFGFAGAALGLGMWFYASFRLFPLVIGFMLLHYLVVKRPALKRFAAQVVVLGAVALFVAAPVAQSAFVDADEFFSRTRTTSVFSMMPPDDALRVVRSNFTRHLLMFNYQGDPNPRHNLPDAPMLDFVSAALFVLGLGVAVTRWRNTALFTLPFWVLIMMVPGIMTIPWEAPQSLRSIGVTPAVIAAISLAVGVAWSAGRAAPWESVRRWTPAAVALLLAVIGFINVNTYFGAQARHPEVFAAFSTDETMMSRHMVEQQRRGYSLLVSRQFLYSLTASLLANNPRLEVVRIPDTVPIDPRDVWLGASIYLEPREASYYRVLRSYYPGARFEEVRPPGGGEPMYYVAVISREQLEQAQGLLARRTLADGSTHETVRRSTEAFWLAELAQDDVPFDFDWEGALHVRRPGQYVLALEGGTDVEVWIDGRRVLWDGQRSARVVPAVGLHWLKVRGRIEDHASFTRLMWQPPGGEMGPISEGHLYHGAIRPVGLAASFYQGRDERPVPDAIHVTPALDTFWYDPVVRQPYLAVMEGTLNAPADGSYRFRARGAGRVRVFIDQTLVAQSPAGEAPESDAISLEAGDHDIRVEYVTEGGSPTLEVLWAPPGAALQPVPIERLTPVKERMLRVVGAP